MAFDDHLPDAFDVLEITEDVVDGRTVETETPLAQAQTGRLVWRDPADVIYDEAGRAVIEAYLLTRYPLAVGNVVDLADGTRLVVSGRPFARHGSSDYRFTNAPVRVA